MANNSSALKRVRQIKARTDRNQALKSKVKSLRKKTIVAAESGDKEGAQKSLRQFSSAVDRAAKRNIFHKNKAANLKAKAAAAVKAGA